MKDTEAAWLAGLIDGEGAIWCRWPKRTNVVVEIKMTHLPTLQRVNELFPARLVAGHLTRGGLSRLPQYRWSVDTLGAEALLRRVSPFMVTKRDVAEAALQLCQRPISAGHMDEWSARLKAAA